ncbi:MAG: 4-alpha-glucanotransferase [Candidatus Marinimicrobia bacterium]|nr:4-alpha-glucanotransferase [Candidatus Neomarinimicrobiota bacterium]
MTDRISGILMHVSSFPNKWGKGDFGPEAYRFVDWLEKTGQSLWQILPLTFPDDMGSPYTSLSANAIYTGYVSPEMLRNKGLLSEADWNSFINEDQNRVKESALALAYTNWLKKEDKSAFDHFCGEHAYWLHDAALFMTMHDHYRLTWYNFPRGLRDRQKDAIAEWEKDQADAILKFKFEQYILFTQWKELKSYANKKGIRVIGDIPIFISGDSSDVWAHRNLFKLNKEGFPQVWTGVPPDLFTATGQLWAQPHYDWAAIEKDDYTWWVERAMVGKIHADIIRIDHFRGFCAAYEVPYGAPTAKKGKWVNGPRADIFKVLHKRIPDLSIIAEDLGVITEDVTALRQEFNYPGMKILQFAFNSDESNVFLPENYDPKDHFVVYTGTHDNNTTRGWYDKASKHEKHMLSKYSQCNADTVAWALTEMAFKSNVMWTVIPIQDLFGLGGSARMNLPGTIVNNWIWQLDKFEPSDELTKKLKNLTIKSGRNR